MMNQSTQSPRLMTTKRVTMTLLTMLFLGFALIAVGAKDASNRGDTGSPIIDSEGSLLLANNDESPAAVSSAKGKTRKLPFHYLPKLPPIPSRWIGRRVIESDDYQAVSRRSSSISSVFEECEDSCARRRTSSYNHKPSCCKGGASSLMMTFHGASGTLYGPSASEVSQFSQVITSCTRSGKGSSSGDIASVKFAPCSTCFPELNSTCATPANVSDSIDVQTGSDVCVFSWYDSTNEPAPDIKLPMELALYFTGDYDDSGSAKQILVHTSCSQPIYYPFAANFETCSQEDHVDPSVSGEDLDYPLLEFIDGVSAKNPGAVFTDCPATGGSSHDKAHGDTCCKGGASFLKTRVVGDIANGTITADLQTALSLLSSNGADQCDYEALLSNGNSSNGKGGKGGYGSSANSNSAFVAFVPCNDTCLLDPFDDESCDTFSDSVVVSPGQEICFGAWDEEHNRIAYDVKLPKELPLLFISDDGTILLHGVTHTSCSRPLHFPYAQALTDECRWDAAPLIDLEDTTGDIYPMYLEFIDGISKGFYQVANELGISTFDITFAGCECTCAPSLEPTAPPSNSPTVPPTNEPTTQAQAPPAPPTNSPTTPEAKDPTARPTKSPTPRPTGVPTDSPSSSPTPLPTKEPSTRPTNSPTPRPTGDPTAPPTNWPTPRPTGAPTDSPSSSPTPLPTNEPTARPTNSPTPLPTAPPTEPRTAAPTNEPSLSPTSGRPGSPTQDCATRCEQWIYENCALVGDDNSLLINEPCDVNRLDDGDGRLLQGYLSTLQLDESTLSTLSREDQIRYHDGMVKLYKTLLSHLE